VLQDGASSSSLVMAEFPSFFIGLLWFVLQGFALFLGLTVFGAMWSGAQGSGKRGWAVALIWALSLLVLLRVALYCRDHFIIR
jgi:hypothetical protein